MRNPDLAKITWQSQKPFNLYNFTYNKSPYNLPYRIVDKVKRNLNPQKYIQRNSERGKKFYWNVKYVSL